MWYDIVIVCILLFFAIRGAAKGFVWQIANIAGIVVCFIFADGISHAVGPYIHLDPPMNHWAALFVTYLGLTLVCFGIARSLSQWIENNKLKEFDRHLGAIFGFIKGVVLSLILTFVVVTFSPTARAALKGSYSGRYAALIMDQLHPILPEKLHDELADYIHQLDDPQLNLQFANDHDQPSPQPDGGQPTVFGVASTVPATQPGALWSQLLSLLDTQSQRVASEAMQRASDPTIRSRLEANLQKALQSIPEDQWAALQQQIVQVGAAQLDQFLSWKLQGDPASTGPTPTPASVTPTPAPGPAAAQRQLDLARDIAARYSSLPNVRQGIEQDIATRVSGLPPDVTLAVLEDWLADLSGQRPDPVPQTGIDATVEERILAQLQLSGIPIQQLPLPVQQRLQGVQAQSPGAGNPL